MDDAGSAEPVVEYRHRLDLPAASAEQGPIGDLGVDQSPITDVRMARGEPCTYIYAASDLRLPVVTFHCTHLERGRSGAPTVVLRSLGESNGMKELVAFQFAGEIGAHGVPVNR